MTLVFLTALLFSQQVEGQVFGNLIERTIQSTVLISVGAGSGSGFLIGDTLRRISVVTAKHVIFDATKNFPVLNSDTAIIQFYAKDFKNNDTNYIVLDLVQLHRAGLLRYDPIHDICVVTFAETNKDGAIEYGDGASRFGHGVHYQPYYFYAKSIVKKSELFLGEDVFIVGFPSSIGLKQIPQFDYTKPLLKRGAIAGISSNFDNIIIDCPVYQGNSGGPVFLERKSFEKYSLRYIGIVSQYIPLVNPTASNKDLTIQTSSYAVIIPIEYALSLVYEK